MTGEGRAAGGRSGVVWSATSADLNANVVVRGAGEGVPEHVNREVDVLIAVMDGELVVTIDGAPLTLSSGGAALVPSGAARSLAAGPAGARYVTCHRARAPLRPR